MTFRPCWANFGRFCFEWLDVQSESAGPKKWLEVYRLPYVSFQTRKPHLHSGSHCLPYLKIKPKILQTILDVLFHWPNLKGMCILQVYSTCMPIVPFWDIFPRVNLGPNWCQTGTKLGPNWGSNWGPKWNQTGPKLIPN